MKTIKMRYTEYEEMVNTIKTQSEFIEELKKDNKVVLIDGRFETRSPILGWLNNSVPKIITTDEDLAKKYLQEEFDSLSRDFIEIKQSLLKRQYEIKKETPRRSSWFV